MDCFDQSCAIFRIVWMIVMAVWGCCWTTVSLKKDFGQKDVPHHKNTAGSTRNTSTSYTRKGKYRPATTSTPPPPSHSGSWDNVEFREKAAINASAAASADYTVLEQHSGTWVWNTTIYRGWTGLEASIFLQWCWLLGWLVILRIVCMRFLRTCILWMRELCKF